MPETYSTLTWQHSDGVGRITLRKPPLNILNEVMIRELDAVLGLALSEDALQVLILQAEGKMFSAGVDIADHTVERVPEVIPKFNAVCLKLADFPAPTIAAVHGHALGGGCELALCCDLIYAAESAKLGLPEIKLAAFPPIAAVLLPDLLGYRRAAELLLGGDPLNAPEAEAMGMINRTVPAPDLAGAVDAAIQRLTAHSGAALRLCKRALRRGAGRWAALPEIEELYLQDLMATADAREGITAFLERRPPVWKHR